MSIFFSGTEARLGSLGISSLFPSPPLPNFIAEWAAILPLVCHIASQRDDFITAGDIALLGKLSIGIFPRLGTLSTLAKLLGEGPNFLDYASSKGGSSRTVWDVRWGSAFPCANGAASASITKCLMNRSKASLQKMPESMPQYNHKPPFPGNQVKREDSASTATSTNVETDEKSELPAIVYQMERQSVRRYQILHVYRFHRKQPQRSRRQAFNRLSESCSYQLLLFGLLIGLSVFLCLFGIYGTAGIIVCRSLSGLMAHVVEIQRPSGYLINNEIHDACMLVAPQENATEWHLYIGDRGVVDTLLNKPMFVVPKVESVRFVARWFWFASLFQLGAMTFVAAQKGWDGVCSVLLLAVYWSFHLSLRGQALAHDWLEREGVDAEVKSFEFGGRMAMIGAIQLFSGSKVTRWMDPIIASHPRRDVWLQCLYGEVLPENVHPHDEEHIKLTAAASLASAEVLAKEFGLSGCGV